MRCKCLHVWRLVLLINVCMCSLCCLLSAVCGLLLLIVCCSSVCECSCLLFVVRSLLRCWMMLVAPRALLVVGW